MGRLISAKVCGLTRAGDVSAAVEAGADLVGFVSYGPSPRHVEDVEIALLAQSLQASTTLGVLVTVDRSRSDVIRLLEGSALAAVQLCGVEEPADWEGTGFSVLRRVGLDGDAAREIERWAGVADAFVLDHPRSPGGSGLRVDPALADSLVHRAPCFLAGGLDADSITGPDVLRLVDAGLAGLDASSGLESSAGIKDHGAVRRFVRAAHALPSSRTL